MTDVEELIKKVTRVYIVTDGQVRPNDMEEMFKCLRQLDTVKKIVNDFIDSRDVPMIENVYSETNKIEKVECFDAICELFKETKND